MTDRRAFLQRMAQAGAALAGTAVLPSTLGASPTILVAPNGGRIVGAGIPDPKKLAARAMEAVRAAGADYADVRLTHDWSREMLLTLDARYGSGKAMAIDAMRMSVGVRALVNGYWGFASGAVWSADEMARLAKAAVGLAKNAAIGGKPQSSELVKAPIVKDGEWTMPIREDPATIPVNEVFDFFEGIQTYSAHEFRVDGSSLQFEKQFKVFASLEGASFSQTTYSTMVSFGFGWNMGYVPYEFLVPPGQGWGYLRDNLPAIRQMLAGARAEEKEWRSLPNVSIAVGKYDVVFDAPSVGSILASSLGNAIQLDRALGFEANLSGTSFIDDPLAMIGNFEVAAPHITVTGSRSAAGAAASVQWDDEGVVPREFTLVKNGILNEFPTTRESASWLAASNLTQAVSVRSNGCARGAEGLFSPIAHTPNLVLTPGTKPASLQDLTAEMASGLVVTTGAAMVDQQALNGVLIPAQPSGGGRVYKIKDGKRVAQMGTLDPVGRRVAANGNVLFRTPNFWKDVEALGGAASARWVRARSRKGEPEQEVPFDVAAVPIRVKQLSFIDPTRRP